jgi:hypothetical protein
MPSAPLHNVGVEHLSLPREEGGFMGHVEVSNVELHTVRDAMRELHRMIDALDRGEMQKIVLTHRNQMRAVVVSVEEYARLGPKTEPGGPTSA